MERDSAWAEQLFRDHEAQVRAFLFRRLPDEADDLVGKVFLTAWERRDRVPEPALPWLYRTASNHVLHARRDFARTTARQPSSEQPLSDDPMDTLVGHIDDVRLVRHVMDQLSDSDAELIRLWAWEQLSAREIAYVVRSRPATIRVRLHRARGRLAALLEAADDAPRSAARLSQSSANPARLQEEPT